MIPQSVNFLLKKPFHPFSYRLRHHFWGRGLIRLGLKTHHGFDIEHVIAEKNADPEWEQRLQKMKDRVFICNIPHQFCGIGHLSSEWNAGYMLAKRYQTQFIHAPLPEPWETFLGWGIGERTFASTRKMRKIFLPCIPFGDGHYDCVELLAFLISKFQIPCNTLFIMGFNQSAYDQTEDGEALRQKYEINGAYKTWANHRIEKKINVAVHIRKGDILGSPEEMKKRSISSTWVIRVLIDLFGEKNAAINYNIYSQGLTAEERHELSVLGTVHFFDNVDHRETFHNLMIADVLLMSRSGFSYLAGCMGRQVVLVPPRFWHNVPVKDPRWIQLREENKSLDQDQITRLRSQWGLA